jgi:hypothetical protein
MKSSSLVGQSGYWRASERLWAFGISACVPSTLFLVGFLFFSALALSVLIFYSWLWRPGSDRLIFTWVNEYTAQNYAADGLVNMTPTETDYFFGDVPPSVESLKNYILIYKRNP